MMRVAYLIQAHKNPDQLNALVECLCSIRSDHCFIHIDKKNPLMYRNLREKYKKHPRVHVLQERVVVNWSGWSQVEATLTLMRHLRNSRIFFDRIHLMSGEDFPMKTPEHIHAYLEKYGKKEFIEYEPIGKYAWRLNSFNFLTEYPANRSLYIRMIQKVLREIQKVLPRRKGLKDFVLYKGSQWFNLSRGAVEYILDFIERNPEFLKRFRYTACPDEHFFQIVLLNSPYRNRIINKNLYYIEWLSGKASPSYLGLSKIKEIKKREDVIFARKIDEENAIRLSKNCKAIQ